MSLFTILAQTQVSTAPLPNIAASHAEIQKLLNIVFSCTGAIALLIITIAGFRYIISRGQPQGVAQAKDAIIYACIGLVVSISALAIVNFVAGSI
jgi:hypothetical protein